MNILVIEDNKFEQVILREAFGEAKVKCELFMLSDGCEAMDFLNRKAPFMDAPSPDVILLDLNLPKKHGREVLTEIKCDAKFQHIPVLIFSNSESPRDICQCYSFHANAYINKPSSFEGLVDLAHSIDLFWSKMVKRCLH